MYRRRRMYRRRYGRKQKTVTIRPPQWKLKRMRATRAIQRDVRFTRLYTSEYRTFTITDGGVYGYVSSVYLKNCSAWQEMAAHYQYIKIHKIVMKVTPGVSVSLPDSQVGLHALAVCKMENGSQTPIKPDANIKFNDVMGIPGARCARQTKELTLKFKPAVYTAGPEADDITANDHPVRYPTYNWIDLNFTMPRLQGFAYVCSQGGKTNQSVTMLFQYYIYVTFKGTKTTIHL